MIGYNSDGGSGAISSEACDKETFKRKVDIHIENNRMDVPGEEIGEIGEESLSFTISLQWNSI